MQIKMISDGPWEQSEQEGYGERVGQEGKDETRREREINWIWRGEREVLMGGWEKREMIIDIEK